MLSATAGLVAEAAGEDSVELSFEHAPAPKIASAASPAAATVFR